MGMYYRNALYSTTSSSIPSAWRTSRIFEELPVRPEKPLPSVPSLVSNVHAQLGGLSYRGAQLQHGERARQVRGTRRLSGENPLA